MANVRTLRDQHCICWLYTSGSMAFRTYAADDQATQNYDVKSDIHNGRHVLSAGTDEIESTMSAFTTTVGWIGFDCTSQKTEGNTAADTAENELSDVIHNGCFDSCICKRHWPKRQALVMKPKP